jgi:phosphoglycolate phosphatase-like HAD superfamily hydrolase
MPKRLLLWDIDSTLIITDRGGMQALKQVVRERFATDDGFQDIEIAGRTDANIAASILRKYGIEPEEAAVADFLESYLGHLERLLPQITGRVLPGVAQILERMAPREDRVLALLTGNLRRGAQLKLERFGLWHYFQFGAFADDHADRNELGAFARSRAKEKHGAEFAVADIDVIGDTGHDIACGKAFGARTIAVATGSWSRERLAEHEPDFLFDDLSDVDSVIATVGW